jgi:prepilin-type N-terminal cleavage/methylation domain-containing protein
MVFRNIRSTATELKKSRKGFTLVELIVVMGLFALGSTILMQNLFSIYHFKEVIRYKKDLNFEASMVLNNAVASMIRSGFAIDYDETKANVSVKTVEGTRTDVDKLSIFTDKAETQYFSIYREPYHKDSNGAEVARLMLEYSNGDIFPLHSSQTVVEDFDIQVPADPRNGGDPDIQPYVNIYLRAHHQKKITQDENSDLMAHENVLASYRTSFTLRNISPSSYKQPLISKTN